MPWREQRRVCSIAVAAARQRAVDLAVAEPWDIAQLSLERRSGEAICLWDSFLNMNFVLDVYIYIYISNIYTLHVMNLIL